MSKIKLPNRTEVVVAGLWIAFILSMASSIGHVAWAFSQLEFEYAQWVGVPAAIAIDAGLASLAYSIQQRRRLKRKTWTLWVGVGLFAGISAFANLLHAMSARSGLVTLDTFRTIDRLDLIRAVVLSASLPLLVLYLGEIVSSNDAIEADRIKEKSDKELLELELKTKEAESKRLEAEALVKAEQLRLDREKQKSERESERLAREQELVRADREKIAKYICPVCGSEWLTAQALGGHKKVHGKEKDGTVTTA